MEAPMMGQQVQTRVLELTANGIVVEEFKDASGKIVRQQSFTQEQLNGTKAQVQKQYDDAMARLNEMLAMYAV